MYLCINIHADVAQPGTARDWKIFPVISFPLGYPGSNLV